MKHSLVLFMIILFSTFTQAQNPNYEDLWTKVENFEVDGLTKSALTMVEAIEKQATKADNHSQVIKAMLYKSKYALVLEEDAQLNIINDLQTKIAASEFPTKNILENILVNLYWRYFNQYRWQFYNRTKTAKKVDTTDFRTWDLQTLFNEIHLHYQNSLENGLMLQQEALENYNVLLHEQIDSKIYRPTLFDFLSHNALEFYKTNETQITKPAYKFEIDNADFLTDAETFSILKIESKDTTSLQFNALKIYKDLIRFHLKDESPLALAQVNIERLKFVKEYATFSDSEALLLKAFKIEGDRIKNQEVSGLYDFEIASIYYQQSLTYQPNTNEKHRWKAKDALELCNQVISKFPKSKGAEKCAILKSQIEQFSFQITTENFLPIQQNARLLLRYKNLNAIKFNAYKISEKQYETFSNIYREDEQRLFIKNLYANKIWKSNLRNEADYQTHTTEVFIPNLNSGRYLIVGFIEENEDTFAFAKLQATNIAFVETEALDHKIFQIIDRNNGEPLPNTKVEVSYSTKVNKITSKTYTTNNLGEIKISKDKSWYRNVNLKVQNADDVAYFGEFYINKTYNQPEEKTSYKSFLFTDRSIYRPGQTVYFKAIAMETFDGKSEVLANESVYAKLYNVNNEVLKTLEFKTNEFGSVAGEFILPNNGLTGMYRLEFNTDSKKYLRSTTSFSVEEYKRPKFEAKFTPVTETYKINNEITIKGNALAYTGNNITDAKVVYRVHRKVQYPRWYFWYRPYINSEPQEITHGETITNANGEFEITFKAIPDQSVNKNTLPVFNYEVTADVTDLNGETRRATTVINVGYHALLANLSIENILDKSDNTHKITIDTKNLNGEFVPATGTIKMYKLKAPNSVLRARPWNAPDYQEISETVFKDLFPHEAYKNEHNSSNWDKGELVLEQSFNTKKTKTIALGKIKKWQSGEYVITLESKDKFGQLVKDEAKTTLFSTADKVPADNQLFSISTNKTAYKIGDTASITMGSAADNISVTVSIEKNRNIIKTEIIKLNANKNTISIPVTKDDLGGFVVHYSFAAFNSFQSGSLAISVPYPNTNLKIETLTFRNKLQPGIDETWQFKIKGPDGEKISSELLASMYDASLDQFKQHNWNFNPIKNRIYSAYSYRRANQSFGIQNFKVYQMGSGVSYPQQQYDQWNWFGFRFGYDHDLRYRRSSSVSKTLSGQARGIQVVSDELEIEETLLEDTASVAFSSNKEELASAPMQKLNDEVILNDDYNEAKPTFGNIQIRKNLQETAFFFPQLKTDEKGNISFSFTTPEALTQWKLQLLAHTKTLENATQTFSTVTQKELMVIPNTPRFLREGDNITISTKIANLTESQLSGQAMLLLTDAISGKAIDSDLGNSENNQAFTVNANGNTQVSWTLNIPVNLQAVQYKIIAKSETFSDGEQNALPVLSNRMLVTETLPMWIKSNQTKTFTLDKLMTNTSTSLTNHRLTLEMASNPAWYAVQALPYLMEYPYECNEQTFSRYYANALASHIANSNPRIQEVFNQWRNTDALLSNLEKNEELKSILIQETPWLRDAQSETEQKKRIALLFDLNKMNNELQSAIKKLESNQLSSGAWAWFNGGYENRYITQHIVTGFGHLNKLNVKTHPHSKMIENAISYLDNEFVKEYKDLKKYNKNVDLSKDHLSYTQLHYLYMRSFYSNVKKSNEVETIINYYQTQIKNYWLNRSLYSKGLMALVSHRNSDVKTASKILKSLKETSITSEALGMYWKANTNSWHWYQAPIETQALLIEAFGEIENDTETIDNLKIWLLKNKQTNRWKTTKATTEAVYALLLQGNDWLSITDMVDVVIGGQAIAPSKLENVKIEAGTGYYKTAWNTAEIKPEMGEVKISKKGKGIAWGSLYWQYFEDLDKITTAKTPLKLSKKLFLKSNTDTGEVISEINSETELKVGDLVRVRIELRSDRNMEFLHMKDMRASGLEPVNVISKYKWQDGLGYYESTKDTSTNFFFDYLQKGVYVFEYDLRVNNAGNMSNGITTIQSMYAPEFSSHSEGVRISIK
ncbi:MAG: MG2 domain-containing protein [Algibacter sp.]|uniref:alpha-2-macroglobulin family protein n=1 Tax=Algibacter sp. TaxID=1872428 RepID=UPI00329936F1